MAFCIIANYFKIKIINQNEKNISSWCIGAAIPIQITTNPMGALSDYLYEKEGDIVDFLLSDEISSFLNDGGVLLVEDECFDELKYSFFKEDEQFLGINKDGKIVYF